MVGQRILVPSTGVRLSQSQPFAACLTIAYVARSSSGSGRRPLKAEITSSNLVRATKRSGSVLLGADPFSVTASVQTVGFDVLLTGFLGCGL